MTWRNCKASEVLVKEVNIRWPKRDKSSDGTIGDAAHASRKSDHNPWIEVNGIGIVRARDIDEDLDGNKTNTGADAVALFQHLLKLAKAGDPRFTGGGYFIYEAHIYSETNNWAARAYTGPNSHSHHLHISWSRNQSGFDSTASYGIASMGATIPEGPFMALTNDQQKELLANSRSTDLRVKQIQAILLGDDPDGKGDTQERQLASLKRIELAVKKVDDQVGPDQPT